MSDRSCKPCRSVWPSKEICTTIRDIERASGQRYRDFGLDHVADDEPASVEVLASYADDGRAWVAVDDTDRPVGYILVDVIDGGGHIEQVSVAPEHQGHGVGRTLIEQVEGWAYFERTRRPSRSRPSNTFPGIGRSMSIWAFESCPRRRPAQESCGAKWGSRPWA